MEYALNSKQVIRTSINHLLFSIKRKELLWTKKNLNKSYKNSPIVYYQKHWILMKKVIALGQSYFAVKTRQQELIENYDALNEDQKRLAICKEMKEHNKLLVAAAKDAGVQSGLDYAIFQNSRYQGLYGGLTAKDIKSRKNLGKNDDILDYMGHEELAANLFRATQTESKLRRENIQGKEKANQAHYAVGKEVRETIGRLGGTMPENLPTSEKSIQHLKREQKKLNNKKL